MTQGDIAFEILPEGSFLFSGQVSHEEHDPPVSLQRLGGTTDALICFLGKILFVCLPSSISCGNEAFGCCC